MGDLSRLELELGQVVDFVHSNTYHLAKEIRITVDINLRKSRIVRFKLI